MSGIDDGQDGQDPQVEPVEPVEQDTQAEADGLALDLDGEFEWDDALDEWEQELDADGVAESKSVPMPAPKRPLFSPGAAAAPAPRRPPGAEAQDQGQGETGSEGSASDAPARPSVPGEFSLFDEDGLDDVGDTRLKAPGEDLLAALEDEVTPGVGVDIDALLDGLDPELDDGPVPPRARPPVPRPPPPRAKKPGYAPPPPPPVPSKIGAKRPGGAPPPPQPPESGAEAVVSPAAPAVAVSETEADDFLELNAEFDAEFDEGAGVEVTAGADAESEPESDADAGVDADAESDADAVVVVVNEDEEDLGERPSRPLARVELKKGLARPPSVQEVDSRPISPTAAEEADESTPILDVPNVIASAAAAPERKELILPPTGVGVGATDSDGQGDEDDQDDDEPTISVAEDDDFPEVASVDGDDDFSDFDDIDDDYEDDYEDEDEYGDDSPAPSMAPEGDAGAQAAARTVRQRKPRLEVFPLVGRGPETMRARQSLLVSLASKAKGSAQARLMVAAAELSEQLGEGDVATALYRDAHDADPRDVVALRALRRDAVQRGEWPAVAALLEEETKLPLSPETRSAALTLLAEVQLTRLDDAAAAQKSARTALGLRRNSVAAALLLAEMGTAVGRDAEALTALERAAEHWEDGGPRAALYSFVALSAERAGRSDKALESFTKAGEADPTSFAATLGLARANRALGHHDQAVAAIIRGGEQAGEGAVAEAFRRAAARVVHLLVGRPNDATTLLDGTKGVSAHRARAAAARQAELGDAHRGALEAWAAAAGGSERALALTELAELEADANNIDAADQALRDAALADDSLATIRVIREILSRRTGGASRLAQVDTTGSALAAAAKIARSSGAEDQELSLVARALDESDSPATASVLSLDLAAAAGDTAGVLAGLGRQVERASGEDKVGPLLALALEARQAGDLTVAEALLEQAREARPGSPIILRTLARQVEVGAPIEGADCWLEEAGSATGSRAAFAATNAGRLLTAAGQEADDARNRALAASPGYGPAAWAQERAVRGRGDAAALSALNLSLAESAVDAQTRASRFVRASLLVAATDAKAAASLLDKARDAAPKDGILVDLTLRLSTDASPRQVAALLTAGAESAPPNVRRGMLLRAAAAHFDGGEATEAAAIYRRVLDDQGGNDPVAARALDQAEIAAGETSRVASRRFDAVKSADDDGARVKALAALADLDLYDRGDHASAMLSLQAILELSPGHLPSLRALERYFMDQSRFDELTPIEAALANHVPDTMDAQSHTRLYTRLALREEDAPADAADEVLRGALRRGDAGFWLGRRGFAAALAQEDEAALLEARSAVATHLSAPLERAEGATRCATALRAEAALDQAIAVLAPAVTAAPEHLAAAMTLAGLYRDVNDHEGAARTFELAGRAAHAPELRAELFHAAGVVLEDALEQPEQAAIVYAEAAQANITHGDLFERYRQILEQAGDKEGLATLTERRIAAGGDVAVLAQLQSRVATLREELGDQAGAKDALRAALSFEGENADALKRLAEISLDDEDYRGAAEALIRLARVRKDREELRWVFFTLGTIYDDNMPDARRAEAAFRRVLKLLPNDVEAMERLANLYERENSLEKSVEMLKLLAENELDPDKNRDHRLRLAATFEARGDLRGAESVLEQTRRNAPVDLVVLEAMSELYRRQNAPQALSMHLNRAVADFRQALTTDATDSAAWVGLTEVLAWRGRKDAARVVASAAVTLGIRSDQLASLVDGQGGIPGIGSQAADEEIDEHLGSQTIPRAARAIFQMAHEVFDKTLPFDERSVKAEKVSARSNTFLAAGKDIAHWFGIPEPRILTTKFAPRVCVPVSASPFVVLVGTDIYASADEREKRFLLARAAKIVASDLVVAARSQPMDLALTIAGLIRSYDPHYAPPELDLGRLEEATRRVGRALSRKLRDPLQPLVMEMAGVDGFEPTKLGLLACELGDRAALLATGSLPAAVGALMHLAGRGELSQLPSRQRLEAIKGVPEAQDLFDFALSDICFDARSRAGADTEDA